MEQDWLISEPHRGANTSMDGESWFGQHTRRNIQLANWDVASGCEAQRNRGDSTCRDDGATSRTDHCALGAPSRLEGERCGAIHRKGQERVEAQGHPYLFSTVSPAPIKRANLTLAVYGQKPTA